MAMNRLDAAFKEVWVGDVPVAGFASPFAGDEFAAMIAVFTRVPFVEKDRLARSLIHQGCRYAVCAGVECDDWESAFDDVDVEQHPEGEASRFVMTTSHKGEALETVAEFLFMCTAIEKKVPERFVVLLVGAEGAHREAVRETVTRVLASLPNPVVGWR